MTGLERRRGFGWPGLLAAALCGHEDIGTRRLCGHGDADVGSVPAHLVQWPDRSTAADAMRQDVLRRRREKQQESSSGTKLAHSQRSAHPMARPACESGQRSMRRCLRRASASGGLNRRRATRRRVPLRAPQGSCEPPTCAPATPTALRHPWQMECTAAF
jgi:hypothetical protein